MKNGIQIGEDNAQKLEAYLASLRQAGEGLPIGKNGAPNLSAIALACGFDRQVLYHNPRCKELLATTMEKVGGDSSVTEPTQKRGYDPKDKRIRDLERQVADLVERLHHAEKLLSQSQSFQRLFEHIQETGRDIVA